MSVLTVLPPTFPVTAAAEMVRKLYGLDGTLSPLDSERDQNFRLTEVSGTRWVVKIANAAESADALAFQAALLRHVAEADRDFPVPHLRPTLAGEDLGQWAGPDGQKHFIRMVSWLPGKPFATGPKSAESFDQLGTLLGRMTFALQSFGHPAAHRAFDWDLTQSGRSRQRLHFIENPKRREILEYFLGRFENRTLPALRRARSQVIHGDANDYNLLIDDGGAIAGLIDFGDAIHSALINELAVAAAYVILDRPAPIDDAARIAAGFHRINPLRAEEIDLLFDLIAMRLVISVTISASRRDRIQDNEYLSISEAPAWKLLERLRATDPVIATAILRHACGFQVAPGARSVIAWIAENRSSLAPILDSAPRFQNKALVPFGDVHDPIAMASAKGDAETAERLWNERAAAEQVTLGIGPWGEDRPVYTAAAFQSRLAEGERRATHLGLDLFAAAGTALHLPLRAKVIEVYASTVPQDYGHAVLLEHTPASGVTFWSLWGHLAASVVNDLRPGTVLSPGTVFARMGKPAENGGWQPHVHIQLLTSRPGSAAEVIGAGEARYKAVWAELFPDPADFVGIPPETFTQEGRSPAQITAARRSRLIRNLSTSYRRPLKIVRGAGVYLYDDHGRAYLDCYNNVAQLGHANPEIVEVLARQAATLNTNTRYLHDNIIAYAEALTATLPKALTVAGFACSGSEANELALRLARNYAKARGVIALDWGYHGNTQALIEVSPYKYKRKGGSGRPVTTAEAALPDAYRAPEDWPRAEIGLRYAASVSEAASALRKDGQTPAAFIAESLPSSAGQIVLPQGYLTAAYAAARAAGALVIADEVQIGFGRIGSHMWGFQADGVVPDIVTMGKPIGNGHPMAAVVTTAEIADRFNNGMEYFNTFGGNPVSCKVGLKVLEILARDQLLENAVKIGNYLLERMRRMAERHSVIGDVRGLGLMLGLDLVEDRRTKQPATAYAGRIVEYCRDNGVFIGTDGPHDNVIKMRPAMIFTQPQADHLMSVLEAAFQHA